VLLLDADLRRGYLEHCFGTAKAPGLTEVLAGSASIKDVLHRNVAPNLDFIATGAAPPNPSDLLLSGRLLELLETVSTHYDLVLVDTAPVLAVSDAAIVAAHCATLFLVARFKKSGIGEIAESAKRLDQADARFRGLILNGVSPQAFGYGSKYGQYRYKGLRLRCA